MWWVSVKVVLCSGRRSCCRSLEESGVTFHRRIWNEWRWLADPLNAYLSLMAVLRRSVTCLNVFSTVISASESFEFTIQPYRNQSSSVISHTPLPESILPRKKAANVRSYLLQTGLMYKNLGHLKSSRRSYACVCECVCVCVGVCVFVCVCVCMHIHWYCLIYYTNCIIYFIWT